MRVGELKIKNILVGAALALSLSFALIPHVQAACVPGADGCIQDLVQEVKLAKQVFNILLEGAADINFESPKDEERLKEKLRETYHSLDLCEAAFDRYCSRFSKKVDAALAARVSFVTNPSEKPLFPWSEENKRIYLDALKRKVCSGSLSLPEITEKEGIYFFNTRCSTATVKSNARKSEQYSIPKDAQCVSGFSGTTSGFQDGKDRHFIIFGGTILDKNFRSSKQVVSMLDDTLIHEFVHQRRVTDPAFKRKTDDFLEIAFARKKEEFDLSLKTFKANVDSRIDSLISDKHLSDSEKNADIRKFIQRERAALMRSAFYIPQRFGPYSKNTLYAGDQADRFTAPSPIFKDGKLASAQYNFGMIDVYSMTSKEEYLAVSLALYRYDRENAEKMFTSEEKEWLRKNWNMAYSIAKQ